MTKVKDWTINSTERNSTIYTAENGLEHLVRQKGRDMAIIKEASGNIIITINNVQILIDDTKKSISVSEALNIG